MKKTPTVNNNSFVKEPERYEIQCTHCGKGFKKAKGNFSASNSPLYQQTGYIPVCRKCVEELFEYYKELLGNERDAIRRICMKFDIYFSDDLLKASRKTNREYTLTTSYISRSNLMQYQGKTYDTTIEEESVSIITNDNDLDEVRDNPNSPTARQLKFWGFGYDVTTDEYKILDEHYKMLTNQYSNADGVQDALLKDLCTINIIKMRAIKKQDFDGIDKAMKLYHSTLKAGNLKMRGSENDGINDESAVWGNFVRDVELYCPAEVYKDKHLFEDVDGIKDYFKRFVLRPMINFFSGRTELDTEFSVGVGETGENDGE